MQEISPIILKSLKKYNLISWDDPNEPHYTGRHWIIEKDGLFGLVLPMGKRRYHLEVPVIMKSIKSLWLATRDDYHYAFILENHQGMLALYFYGNMYGGKHRFTEIIWAYITDGEILIVKENGLYGYLDMEKAFKEIHVEPKFLEHDPGIIWDEFSTINMGTELVVRNKEGLCAIYDANWNQLTDFVLKNRPYITKYYTYGVQIDGKHRSFTREEFFLKFGIKKK